MRAKTTRARMQSMAGAGSGSPATLPAPDDLIWTDPAESDRNILEALQAGTLADPFALLGPHHYQDAVIIRTFQPGAHRVEVLEPEGAGRPRLIGVLRQVGNTGLFTGVLPGVTAMPRYVLDISWPGPQSGEVVHQLTEDAYSFGPLLSDLDMHLWNEGRLYQLGDCFGAHPTRIDGVDGTRFAVWAPNARRVSVVGDFNSWDGRRHPMRLRHDGGVWELFVPRISAGAVYKYELIGRDGQRLPHKADPVARCTELPPRTASVVPAPASFCWTDQDWVQQRAERQHAGAPMSIYEVHAGSWRPLGGEAAATPDWHALADQLVPYVAEMGFTHIELLPIMEHPFGGSWGYQPLGQFAPSARFGSPAAFAAFVDRCHGAGIGVILDWVPAHFPSDAHGLSRFDGTALYEHEDPREGFHPDWHTLIYNTGRREVANFLIASALEWLERYHVDGLRVDAVSSMLYRDYSRKDGEWVPNSEGGRENHESIHFLRELNRIVAERCPGVMVIAEESTAWPGVTAREGQGGLGFSYKWNMGWMHDTLRYVQRDPLYRQHHHHDLTFGLCYAHSERFILPISHDEVVHGKASLLQKMPGDAWQKFANLRAYLGFMWTHPGKKLLFMGCEFGQQEEWNHDGFLQWELLGDARHAGVQQLVRDLNHLYGHETALHAGDADPAGFQWLIGDDMKNSAYAFLRRAGKNDTQPLLVVCNFTPVPRHAYRVGVPVGPAGSWQWKELLNTDAAAYGGTNAGNGGMVIAEPTPAHGQPMSLVLTLPPLSTVVFRGEY